MKKNLTTYFAAALLVTLVCGLIYVSVQQLHRSAANDPQLQLARDISERLKNNQSIEKLWEGDSFDISKSLAVFKTLYNKNGEVIQSTGVLNGKPPQLPKGVFDYSARNTEDVLTWQPQQGVRMAMVVEAVGSPHVAFVAVGRSLKETEKRVGNLTGMLLIGWLLCLGIIVFHWLFRAIKNKAAYAV
jgi:hypothetical protein